MKDIRIKFKAKKPKYYHARIKGQLVSILVDEKKVCVSCNLAIMEVVLNYLLDEECVPLSVNVNNQLQRIDMFFFADRWTWIDVEGCKVKQA